ncbi:ATP-binding protein [Amantichitinum ursilacus]|uniref:histidine kinase n=1 Tax=Amantichitinum ursilacus TaxID=857265 RepID=A0A0N0XKJ1_9NEIS|nr:ATP-binding protein [Amantichitinum ursilacus]KPC52879.1 Signal transduction histidine-protein kinase BaeS [Amantichitinum ursilacus]
MALAAPGWAGATWPINAGAVDLMWMGLLFLACMLGAGGILFMPRRRVPRPALPLQPPARPLQDGIADLVHEIRAPLSVISGEIEAAQCGLRAIDAQTLDALAVESARLARLLRDLEGLTSCTSSATGAAVYQFGALALDTWLQRWLRHRNTQLAGAGIALHLQIETRGAVLIQADEQRLAQLFDNLLQNTLRYTDAPGTLRVALTRSAHGWPHIRWEDSAPGVPPEQMSALRLRHWRGDHTVQGSGLGLDIASRIAAAHHARFEASPSQLGGLCWSLEFVQLDGERG